MAKKSSGPEVKRRLSARDICGKVSDIVKEAGASVELFHVYGIASGKRVKETTYGASVGFTGTFEAVNALTGETVLGAVLYVPEPMHSELLSRLDAALHSSHDANVEFAATIGAKPDAKVGVGYSYTWKPFLKPEQRGALDKLRGEVKGLIGKD